MNGAWRKMTTTLATAGLVACLTPAVFSQEVPQWVKTLKISGDLSLRTEYKDDDQAAVPNDQLKERARVRLSLETTPVEKVSVSLGMQTSTKNPNSSWADFSDMKNNSIELAHAQLRYTPSDKVTIYGGKIKNSVFMWKTDQLVWDNDLNPYGAVAAITGKLSDRVNFFLNAGIFAVTDYQDTADTDKPMNTIFIAQPGVEYKKGNLSLKGALAFQQFSLGEHSGDWIDTTDSYTLINPAWEVKLANVAGAYGVTFKGQYVKNVNEDADEDTNAYKLYASFGNDKLDRIGTWSAGVAYRRFEENAALKRFTNSTYYAANPGKGMEYSLNFGLVKNLSLSTTVYDWKDFSDAENRMLDTQIDLVYKF